MKNTKPEKNIIYTFAYSNGTVLKCKFVDIDEKGYCAFCDLNNNRVVKMTVARFSFIYKNNLVSAFSEQPKDVEDYSKAIAELESVPPLLAEQVRTEVGKSPHVLALELKKMKEPNKRLLSDVKKAQQYLKTI